MVKVIIHFLAPFFIQEVVVPIPSQTFGRSHSMGRRPHKFRYLDNGLKELFWPTGAVTTGWKSLRKAFQLGTSSYMQG